MPTDGLLFPPCGVDDLPHVMRPRDKGGVLEKSGVVEVVSSLERDGRPVFRDLRWGVYVVLEAPNDYAADCFRQYGLKTDASGRYAAMYKPYHLIGLELNISILSAALRNEPTGQPHGFRGDVAAVAKRDLRAGEMLDGEGGYTVWGKLMPAAASLAAGALPIGLAHRVKLKNNVAHGAVVRWSDVEVDEASDTIKTRKAMEAKFARDEANVCRRSDYACLRRQTASMLWPSGSSTNAPVIIFVIMRAQPRLPVVASPGCERGLVKPVHGFPVVGRKGDVAAGLRSVFLADPEECLPVGPIAGGGWTVSVQALDAERTKRLIIEFP